MNTLDQSAAVAAVPDPENGKSASHPSGPTTDGRHSGQLRLLLDGDTDDIESPDDRGRTRLHRAIHHAAEHAVAALLKTGSQVNSPDEWGNTPLWLAIYHHHDGSTIAETLIAHQADPSIENRHGVSALQLAQALSTDNAAVAELPLLTDTAPTIAGGDDQA
ncbi:ankyrin repeat domain-containing protein [Mycobacterium sp. BMJ-28]